MQCKKAVKVSSKSDKPFFEIFLSEVEPMLQVILRHMYKQNMRASAMPVINVNTKQHNQVISRDTLTQCIKVQFTIVLKGQYDYKANFAGNLKEHSKSIHEGVRYPCNQCDYKATLKGNLKKHKMSKHQ